MKEKKMWNQSQILTVVACCIGSIPPSNSNIDIIENLGTSDVELVIASFTINFGVTICELRDSDLDLKEIFLNNHKKNITLKDFKRIMNYNQKGCCYIRCLELDDQETMTGVVQEHFSQKLYECETNKLSPLKTEIFSGGMRFVK